MITENDDDISATVRDNDDVYRTAEVVQDFAIIAKNKLPREKAIVSS